MCTYNKHATYKHKRRWHVVYLHTMKFIQPHLLRLDLPVEWGKLLCHSVTKTNSSRFSLCLLVCMSFTQNVWGLFFFLKKPTTFNSVSTKQMADGYAYRNTTSSTIRTEISDRNPRSSLLFILFLGVNFDQRQTWSLHFQ